MVSNSPILDRFLEPFKSAAAEGAALELKLRLLAGITPSLHELSLKKKLNDIEDKFIEFYNNDLSDKEKQSLKLSRELRNKILHADFRDAEKCLNELGIKIPSSQVKKIDFPKDASADVIKSKIENLISGNEGILVDDILSNEFKEIYGWLLKFGSNGGFEKAVEVFKDTSAIIEKLLVSNELYPTR